MMAARRDLSLAEMEVISELALATPDLAAVRDRLLARWQRLRNPPAGGGWHGPRSWSPKRGVNWWRRFAWPC